MVNKVYAYIRTSIVYKWAVSVGVLIVITVVAMGYNMVRSQMALMEQQLHSKGQSIADLLSASTAEPVFAEDWFAVEVLSNSLNRDPQIKGIGVVDETGKFKLEKGSLPSREWTAMAGQFVHTDIGYLYAWEEAASGIKMVSFISPISFRDVVGGQVVITLSREATAEALAKELQNLALLITLIAVVVFAIARIMSRRLAKPITRLVEATEKIAGGDFGVEVDHTGTDEIAKLSSAFNKMANGLLRKQQVESALSVFLDDSVAENMLDNIESIEVGGRMVDATVLFVDIAGFTAYSSEMKPNEVATFLNEYFSFFTACGHLHHGVLDKFIGDSAMITFGATQDQDDHCINAVNCAILLQNVVRASNLKRLERQEEPMHIRIGINTGSMMAGLLGSKSRMEYTVIGDAVNVASRLCDIAGSGEIAISDAVYNHPAIKGHFDIDSSHVVEMKGKNGEFNVHLFSSVLTAKDSAIDRIVDRIVAGKSVQKPRLNGLYPIDRKSA